MNLTLEAMLGERGGAIAGAMRRALEFLDAHSTEELLTRVGERIDDIPSFDPLEKSTLCKSYGGDAPGPCDDLLVGRGLFYVTEQRQLCLDCTAGHYQMVWGYNHPELLAACREAVDAGIVWDNHCNIPQSPVKLLGRRLLEVANDPRTDNGLDRVLLGCCTGSIACEAALKMQLVRHEHKPQADQEPVLVVINGHYHGTNTLMQYLRGMWPRYHTNLRVVAVQPNDRDELERTFREHGRCVAAFWAEPVLMNREVIALDPDYLRRARALCDDSDAVLCIDEIQTGFWRPHVFGYRDMGFTPDMVIAGKGMTAGLHPQSAVIFHDRDDRLAQYDAISTNGSAPLAAYAGLCCLEMVRAHAPRIEQIASRITECFRSLVEEFGGLLQAAHGRGHCAGLKFHRVEDALAFHRQAVASGLWVRAHAYHEGHSTVLTKMGLLADEKVVDFVAGRFRGLLRKMAEGSAGTCSDGGDSGTGEPR